MKMWLMIGTPGSGKTTFAKKYLMDGESVRYISRDEIRFSMLRANDNYFSKEKKVYDEFIAEIKEVIDDEDSFITDLIVDATHLNWTSRRKLFAALGMLDGGYEWVNVIPVIVNTPVEECVRRNNKRVGLERVPEDKLRQMDRSRTDPRNDPFNYMGFFEVTV